MENETDLRDPDQLGEPVSSDGDSEGSESEASEVEPEPAAVGHGYNLRPKRAAARAAAASGRYKKDVIVPGEGVVADHNHVGGRDERVLRKSYGANAAAESSDVERSNAEWERLESGESGCSPSDQVLSESYDGSPRPRHERHRTTLGRRHSASSLLASMSREELEAQSARLLAHLRESKQERAKRPPPPTNELVIRRDFSRPSDAGRSEKSRREPRASNLLGHLPVKPGRGLYSDKHVN